MADTGNKWTIRDMGPEDADRIAATAAAKRARESMADWLRGAIRLAIAAERGEPEAGAYEVLAPGASDTSRTAVGPTMIDHFSVLTVEEIARSVDYLERIAKLRGPTRKQGVVQDRRPTAGALLGAQRLLEQRLITPKKPKAKPPEASNVVPLRPETPDP